MTRTATTCTLIPYTTLFRSLDTVGISRADRGKIAVNDKLQTSVPNIYAIGDVTDIKQLAHFASAQGKAAAEIIARSEEHTSELQSLRHLVCRLLLEKKKKQK